MANPVALSAITIEPPPLRRAASTHDSAPLSPVGGRARAPAHLRLVHDAGAEAAYAVRARAYEAMRREAALDRRALEDENETLRDAGRRKAPAALSFTAQQIAQEHLSPGLHFENYPPAIAASAPAARHGEAALTNGSALHLLV
jgi:hypothetical protein